MHWYPGTDGKMVQNAMDELQAEVEKLYDHSVVPHMDRVESIARNSPAGVQTTDALIGEFRSMCRSIDGAATLLGAHIADIRNKAAQHEAQQIQITKQQTRHLRFQTALGVIMGVLSGLIFPLLLKWLGAS